MSATARLRRLRLPAIDPLRFLEWSGAALSMAGALVIAATSDECGGAKWGFALYLWANASWLLYGIVRRIPGLVAQMVVFTIAALWGLLA